MPSASDNDGVPPLLRATSKAVQAVAVSVSLYQAGVTLAGYTRRPRQPLQIPTDDLPTVAVVVCARNEEGVIADVVRDLDRQDYPRDRWRTVVVAHNCSDETARIARCAGADVLELRDDLLGKVPPMQAAVQHVRDFADYVAILDADARVDPDFLRRMIAHTVDSDALQAETRPAAPRTELERAYGFGRQSRNVLWWRPRSRLGLGTTMTGSGFLIRTRLMEETLPLLRSGTDDLELTVRLAAAGHRVAFVEDTQVTVEEPARLAASLSQRARWVRGHMGTIARAWPQLAKRGAKGDAEAIDLAIFLLVPTRVLTRTGVTVAALTRFLAPSASISAGPIALAAAAEALIPLFFCSRAGLLEPSRKDVRLAIDHVLLGFLWFPIGAWSLLTARKQAWSPIPRQRRAKGAD